MDCSVLHDVVRLGHISVSTLVLGVLVSTLGSPRGSYSPCIIIVRHHTLYQLTTHDHLFPIHLSTSLAITPNLIHSSAPVYDTQPPLS